MPRKCPDAAREYQRRYREENKEKVLALGARWRARNKEKIREHNLLRNHGLSLERYEALLEAQGGVCAICAGEPGERRLVVDHNHDTGDVRGLLCGTCNLALGGFQDNPDLLASARVYLIQKGDYRK